MTDDVFDAAAKNITTMAALGAVGGAFAGRKVGKVINRGMNNGRYFKRWRENFKRENGRAPSREEVQEFKGEELEGSGSPMSGETIRDGLGRKWGGAADMRTGREVVKQFARGKGPAAIGAGVGGALGAGYAAGRKR